MSDTISTVSALSPTQLSQLPDLYFQAWFREGLCESRSAAEKVLEFDPKWSFVITRSARVLALINTLPLNINGPEEIPVFLPTYDSIEKLSREHVCPPDPDWLVCFSIVGRPDTKVEVDGQDISLSRYLISYLRRLPYRIAVYTRPKSVPMHIHLGADPTPVAVLTASRPEDTSGDGTNVILTYPPL